jgi:RecA/RadA recombinase
MAYTFIPTGSELLNRVLGGGYALGRMAHIVGDPSTNKTGLAIEACANFHHLWPEGKILYCDSEAAFDEDYAEVLGLPREHVEFMEADDPDVGITVEEFDRKLDLWLQKIPSGQPGVCLLDSVDALPTEKEAAVLKEVKKKKKKVVSDDEADEDDDAVEKALGSGYGTEKSKIIGRMFRSRVQKMKTRDAAVIAISQTRDNITKYGPRKIFSGGNALKFYASQQIMLKKKGNLTVTVDKVVDIYGVQVEAFCSKNKCGVPFLKCEVDIVFGFGIDDLASNLDWLASVGKLDILPAELSRKADGTMLSGARYIEDRIKAMAPMERAVAMGAVADCTGQYWADVRRRAAERQPGGDGVSKYDLLKLRLEAGKKPASPSGGKK